MRRGDIYAIARSGDFSGKPRPGVIVQFDLFNEYHPSITVCPLSGHITNDHLYRVSIACDEGNGLKMDSEIEIDKVQSVWRQRVGRHIGRASDDVMAAVDVALRRWLDL